MLYSRAASMGSIGKHATFERRHSEAYDGGDGVADRRPDSVASLHSVRNMSGE